MQIDPQQIEKKNSELSTYVEQLSIANNTDYEKGADLRAIIKTRVKKLEEAKLMTSKPYRDQVTEINGLYKKMIDPLIELVERLDISMLRFKKEEKAKILSRAVERGEEAAEGAKPPFMPAEAQQTQVRTEKGVTSIKQIWKGRLVSKSAAFAKFPEMFEIPQSKLDEFARFMQIEKIHDGIEVYIEEVLSTRT